jgi:hypothetical protein
MSKMKEIKEAVSTIIEIYIGAKENFKFCCHLHYSKTEMEAQYLKTDRHLQFIRHSLWRLTIIELSKLFSNGTNDVYCLKKLIQNLKPDGAFAQHGINLEKVSQWENLINGKSSIIKNINDLRNKIYAHTDPNREIYKGIEIYFSDISELINITSRLINEISIALKMPTLFFESPSYESQEFDLVTILAEHHQKKINKTLNHMRKK